MELTRRDFLQTGVGTISVLGFSLWEVPGLEGVCEAAEARPVAEIPLVWMATGVCSGCSISLLNSASPSIQELLLGQVLPGKHVSVRFHTTIMASAGELAMKSLQKVVHENQGRYLLVVDGATAARHDGLYCAVGEANGKPITGYSHVRDLGRKAQATLAVGACAAYGGIPAAKPNPTGCLSVSRLFQREGVRTPVVNIPGCPPHPDWIVGTIAMFLVGGLKALKLDEHARPAPFFSSLIHDNCPFRGHFDRGEFAEHFGQHGCLIKLGCKGPITHADCPHRLWNNGTNWCIGAGHPCIGCCEPQFPFEGSLFHRVEPAELAPPAVLPPASGQAQARPIGTGTAAVAGGVVGAAIVGAAVGAAKLAKKQNPSGAHDAPNEQG
ncbi:MAG: hydrogenase small subunit [Phycisphaerae bacterium]